MLGAFIHYDLVHDQRDAPLWKETLALANRAFILTGPGLCREARTWAGSFGPNGPTWRVSEIVGIDTPLVLVGYGAPASGLEEVDVKTMRDVWCAYFPNPGRTPYLEGLPLTGFHVVPERLPVFAHHRILVEREVS